MRRTQSFIDRFYGKVEKTSGCWIFKGSRGNDYGHCRFYVGAGRSADYAHRIAWELENHRTIPANGVIRHSCDTPDCVRPDHLILGTQRDNVYDMLKRGRFKRSAGPRLCGELNPGAKLSTSDVVAILACYKTARFGYRRLARFFGVTPITIKNIVTGKRWSQVIGHRPDGTQWSALVGRVMPTVERTA